MVKDKPTLWSRITRPFQLAEPTQSATNDIMVPINIETTPVGSYGTEIYSGYSSEEYLNTLRGTQRADIFDQMRRGDPQVVLCLSSVKNPIMSANWEVEPADDTDEAKADADLIRHILFDDMDIGWVD